MADLNTVPKGGQLVNVNGRSYVIYDIGGAFVFYDFNEGATAGARSYADFNQLMGDFPMAVNGGFTDELKNIKEDTYQDWINKSLNTITGGNTAWMNDKEVRSIFFDAITNNISDQELQARLRNTAFFKAQSDTGKNWNNASPAQQQMMLQDAKVALAQSYFATTGLSIDVEDPWLTQWATQVASGKTSAGYVVETQFKKIAEQNAESPWMREKRNSIEQQRKRGVDISNKTQEVKDLAARWGVGVDNAWAKSWAKSIVENVKSDADLLQTFKQQAATLYKWKDPEVETMTAAQPYLESYAQIMEKAPPSLLHPEIQDVLNKGLSVSEAQQKWRGSEKWLYTNNARQMMTGIATEVGKRMGFE